MKSEFESSAISKLDKKFTGSRKDFLPFIDSIRFPRYKSLSPNLELRFNWPIVAIIGPNGSNKSSILQALSAAPDGRSLSQFWFSTDVDDIDASSLGENRHRFIYTYQFDNTQRRAECRKSRVKKLFRGGQLPKLLQGKSDPDYWEPTKRVATDAMDEIPTTGYDDRISSSRDRWNQIRKPVVYLDFRAELSAFDKFIHHQSYSHRIQDPTGKRHKAILASKFIAKALSSARIPAAEQEKVLEPLRYLDDDVVKQAAAVLEKPITRIAILKHRFFGPEGYTVRLFLSAGHDNYSEAHAGSGEYAVIRLIDAVVSAPARSLILLDEPEVSLHPGAQRKLMRVLASQVLLSGHQMVIATHSPAIVDELPEEAITVLSYTSESGRVSLLANGCSHSEAFASIGASSSRLVIYVEDELAKELVLAALRRRLPLLVPECEVKPVPGGAEGIVKTVLPSLAVGGLDHAAIMLDGDQRPGDHASIPDSIPTAVPELQEYWKLFVHKNVPTIFKNSDHSGEIDCLRACISWAKKHLGFLPGSIPEDALAKALGWDLSQRSGKELWIEKTIRHYHLTSKEEVTAKDILECQRHYLAQLPQNSTYLDEIAENIKSCLPHARG